MKHIDEKRIREEALELAIRSSLQEAFKTEKIDAIAQEEFKILTNTKDKLEYVIRVNVAPTIKLSQYKGLKVKKDDE